MADVKISNLPAAAALDGTEVAPVVQSGATKKALLSAVLTYVQGAITIAESQVTSLVADLAARLVAANNLSDLVNAGTARTNLGLGTAATQNKVAAGAAGVLDATDPTTTNSRAPTAHASSHASGGSDPLTLAESQITGLVSDLAGKQPLDATLTALAALATAADKLIYATGSDSFSTTDLTSFIRTLLAAANAAAARSTLGLVIGTDVQAQDAELAALAGLTSAADKLSYFTGSGTAALATLTSFIRTLLDDADAATARTTLGVGPALSANVFTSTTTGWAIPSGATLLYLEVVGAGGGGGSGRRGAAGGIRGGGGGGGSGARSCRIIRVADLGGATTLDITIGAGSAGGAAQTVNDTNGAGGGIGGTSSIAIPASATQVNATGGGGGGAGSSAGGGGGAVGVGGDSGTTGGTGGSPGVAGGVGQYAPSGGGGGGNISAADAVANGGPGGVQRNANLAAGAAGSAGGNGGNGNAATGAGSGSGGGGGASSITGVAGSGGNGGNYGAAGGGGGASLNGNNSGAGGGGAQGVAVIIAW